MVAGVAGGLADRFGWPVALVRIVFGTGAFLWGVAAFSLLGAGYLRVDLAPGGGLGGIVAGLLAFAPVVYALLWIAVPREDRPRSALGRGLHQAARPLPALRSFLGMALVIAGGAVLAEQLGIWETNVALAVGLIAAGVWLYRRDADRAVGASGARPPEEAPATAAETLPLSVPAVRRAPRERSPLAWLTLGVAALAVGVTATVGSLGELEIPLVVYPSIGLIVLAGGLLVGTMLGRARWLIAPALLLVPVTLLSSVVDVPIEGGYGGRDYAPDSVSEVADEYRLILGRLGLQLEGLKGESGLVEIDATVAFGEVFVVVPFDAHVVATGGTGLGTVSFGRSGTAMGLDQTLARVWEPRLGDGTTIVLRLEAGVGDVSVYRLAPTRRDRRELAE